MKSFTANFITETAKKIGAQPRTLLEIDVNSGTLYYSDQSLTVSGQEYLPKVLDWSKFRSQVIPGEEVLRFSDMRLLLNNSPDIHAQFEPGQEIRVYMWFVGLVAADKALLLKGVIADDFRFNVYNVSFSVIDMGEIFNKVIGDPITTGDYPNADPDDVGLILPVGYGAIVNHKCRATDTGGLSTLVDDITSASTTIVLNDASRFPSSGTVIIGAEPDIVYTGKSGDTLTGVTGISNDYSSGTVVIEYRDITFTAVGHVSKLISSVNLLPYGLTKDYMIKIDSGDYVIDLNNGGKTTIKIPADKIINIRKSVGIIVETQPESVADPATHKHEESGGDYTTLSYFCDTYSIDGDASPYTTDPERLVDNALNEYCNIAIGSFAVTTDLFNVSKVLSEERTGTIYQIRARVQLETSGITQSNLDHHGTIRLAWKGGEVAVASYSMMDADGKVTQSTGWYTPTSPVWGDFLDSGTDIRVTYNEHNAQGGSELHVHECWYEVRYYGSTADETIGVTRTTDVVIGDSSGDSLGGYILVDGEGIQDDGSGHWTGTANALIEKPGDVFHHLLETYSNGAVHADIDISGSFAAAAANLPSSYKFSFTITSRIELNKLLAGLAIQIFCRFFWETGLAKLKYIKTTGTADKTIDTDDQSILVNNQLAVEAQLPGIADVFNSIEVLYGIDRISGDWGDEDAYSQIETDSDSDSVAIYEEQKRTFKLWAVSDSSHAADLLGKWLDFYKYPHASIAFPVYLSSIELEPGDLVVLVTSQLSISGLYEVLGFDYGPPQKQFPQITYVFRDLHIRYFEFTEDVGLVDEIGDYRFTYIEDIGIEESYLYEWTEVAPMYGVSVYSIFSLALYNGTIYGGDGTYGRLLRWDGSGAWSLRANVLGETSTVSLLPFNSKLYGGMYPNAKLYEHTTSSWTQVAQRLGNERTVWDMVEFGSELYGVTGHTSGSNGKLIKWDGSGDWVQKAPGFQSQLHIYSSVVFNGKIYGGTYPNGYLYEWNGTDAWVEVAGQLNSQDGIQALVVFNGKIYGSTRPNGRLFEWNGTNAWVEVAGQLGSETIIYSLAEWNGSLYGGTYPNGKLYKWNGTDAWEEAAAQLNSQTAIRALIVFNGALYGGTGPGGRLFKLTIKTT